MAAIATHLADTSALARVRFPAVAQGLVPMLHSGVVAGCGVTDFEMLWTTRTAGEFDAVERELLQLEHLWIEPADWLRAREVQRESWHRGQMRAVGLPALLVAAVAERHRVTVLHYDRDFDLIATGLVSPRPGSSPPARCRRSGLRLCGHVQPEQELVWADQSSDLGDGCKARSP